MATTPQAWPDRNLTWWAVGAGPGDTGTPVVTMANSDFAVFIQPARRGLFRLV